MKRIILVVVALVAFFAVDAKPNNDAKLDLRIGTYNVWAHYARAGLIRKGKTAEGRSWEKSREAVANLIVDINCDFIGMQEVSGVCRDDLAKLVKAAGGKKYQLWWVNTYPEGHRREVGNGVFYDKRKFKLSEQNIYYFSPTPEVMSKGWDEQRYYRAALTAVVTHKKTGKKFFFIATHGPLGKVANAEAGRLLVEFDKKYNRHGLPTIVVGDMNARPGQGFHTNMCSHYEDCYLSAEKKCGTVGTFNSASGTDKNFTLEHRRIDHIYVHSTDKGKIRTKNYVVNRDKCEVDGKKYYPSDHNPVYVDLTIE